MRFHVVLKRSAVWYEYQDPRMGHGSCSVITPLWSGVRRRVDNHGFIQFVAGCVFDPAGAYLVNWRSLELYWLPLSTIVCWVPYTLSDGKEHRLSAA